MAKKRRRTKASRSNRKRNARIAILCFSIFLIVMFGLGIRSFFVVPPKAKEEAKEIEEMLRKQQEEEEARKQAMQEELARKAKEAEEKRLAEEAEAKDLAEHPWKAQFSDASEMTVVGIGDSVMLAAINELYNTFPNGYFDAVFGRAMATGKQVAAGYAENGTLGDVVVFSLGTNSYIEEADVEELINYCGDRPNFWITTYGVANDSNEKTRNVIARHDRSFMIDWESVALAHPGYILADGLHPNAEGSVAYAQCIHDTINECLELEPKGD